MGLEFIADDLDSGRSKADPLASSGAGHAVYLNGNGAHASGGYDAESHQIDDDEGKFDPDKPQPVLRLWHVVALTFFAVSGGPYGFEDVVGAAGGYVSLIAIFLLPFFWSLPLGLMTAELSSLLPENGGFIIWVSKSFGPFVSWINSAFGILNGCFDNSLYPLMFVDYINTLLEETDRGRMVRPIELLVKVTIIAMVTLLNLFGVDAVGGATLVFGGLVMCPFIAMVLAGLPKIKSAYEESPPLPQPSLQLGRFLAVMAWNNCGWDSTGNCAAEICEPAKTLPKAMLIAVGLITMNYVLPLLVALPVVPDPDAWTDGTWVAVGNRLAGPWLSHWVALMAMVSALGMFSALLCTTSRLLYGVASNGLLPKPLTKLHPRWKTPVNAIVLNAVTTLMVTTFPGITFADCAQIAMMFYLSTTVLKFVALVRLRRIMASSPRPFKIPLGDKALIAFVIPPVLTCAIGMFYMEWFAWAFFGGALFLAIVAYRYVAKPDDPTSLVNLHGLKTPSTMQLSALEPAPSSIEMTEKRGLLGAGVELSETHASPSGKAGNGETTVSPRRTLSSPRESGHLHMSGSDIAENAEAVPLTHTASLALGELSLGHRHNAAAPSTIMLKGTSAKAGKQSVD